uniref:Uncharacterized protein n=1 Tax=Grammatophora oceanica TaxID=210454 RepID=A0A7S1UXP2_9STRA|mmetsp:Transcript_28419/g.41898  ORF Transcript_28419/g.41898 Transcript_28419/m.41898 type:complete len:210 (+) Transcript_28419:178-807(+)
MPPLNAVNDSDSHSHNLIGATSDRDDSEHSTFRVLVDASGKPLPKTPEKVRFGSVSVREYERIVGDHPDCRVGPPIAIGWGFVEQGDRSLDNFEAERSTNRRKSIRLTSITRRNILHHLYGIPEKEIRMSEKEVQIILQNRVATNKQTKASLKIEEAKESARRKFRRVFSAKRFASGLEKAMRDSSRSLVPVPGAHQWQPEAPEAVYSC